MEWFDIFVNLIESIMIACFLYFVSGNTSRNTRIGAFLLAAAEFVFITVINLYSQTQGLFSFFDVLICFTFLVFSAKKRFDEALALAMIPDLVIGNVNTLVMSGMLLIFGQQGFEQLMSSSYIFLVILVHLIHCLVFFLLCRYLTKNDFVMNRGDNLFIAGILAFCLILPQCFEAVIIQSDQAPAYLSLGTSAVLLITCMFCLQLKSISVKNTEQQRQKYEIQLLQEQQAQAAEYKKTAEELYQLRHDVRHLMSFIDFESVAMSSGAKEESELLLNRLSSSKQIITPSRPLSVVLNMKRDEAEKMGIDFKITCFMKNDIRMDEVDQFLLFSNLLDNAIKHIGHEKKIRVEITEDDEQCYIRIQNSVDQIIADQDGNLLMPLETGEHGNGVRICQRIAESHGALLNYTQCENLLEAAVVCDIRKS